MSATVPSIPEWKVRSFHQGIRVVEVPNFLAFFQFVTTAEGGGEDYWRGQRREEWEVCSTLSRERNAAASHLSRFRRAIESCPNVELDLSGFDGEDGELRLWALGQHHGLVTPLIDWSIYPFAALFFAFAEPDPDYAGNRVVYQLHGIELGSLLFHLTEGRMQEFRKQLENPPYSDEFKALLLKRFFDGESHPYVTNSNIPKATREKICRWWLQDLKKSSLRMVAARDRKNHRIHSQGGIHVCTPGNCSVEAWIREVRMTGEAVGRILTQVLIPNSERRAVLSGLNKMNINYRTLFPDLEGAARHANMTLREGRGIGPLEY